MFSVASFKQRRESACAMLLQLLWCLFVALLFIFRNGYQFNCYDQEEHLPLVYKLARPSLYPHDYFVQPASAHTTVRTYYAWTVYAFSKIWTVETVCFLLFITCVTLAGFFILKIAQRAFGNGWSSYLAPVFVLLLYNAWTVGGNPVMDLQLLGSGFALVFCLAAVWQFIDGRYYATGILLGIASIYQVLMGLHLMMILIPVLLLTKKKAPLKKIAAPVLLYIIFSCPVLIPVLLQQFVKQPAHDRALANYALINFRQAHHYLPRAFPVAAYLHHTALLALAAIALLLMKIKQRQFFFLSAAVVIAGCIVYTIGFELLQSALVAKTQWFKTTVWTTAFAGIILAGFAGQLAEVLLPASRLQQRFWMPALVVFNVLLLLHITNQPLFTHPSWLGRYMVGKYPHADITKMHEWIKTHTPEDAVILSFPYDPSLLCESQRSTPVTYKAIIHEPALIEKWYHDFTRIYNIDDTPGPINIPRKDFIAKATEWYNRAGNTVLSKRCRYNYRIAETGTAGAMADSGEIVHREGNYVLLKNRQ